MNNTIDVAATWFQMKSLSDDVTLIFEPEVDEFIQCNIWHIRGRHRDLLIDTGLGVRSLRGELSRLTERPVVCLATHCHFDHWGGLHEFDERLGHPLEAAIYAAPTGKATLAEKYISQSSFKRLPSADYEPLSFSVRPAPLTRHVDEGDIIDLGNRVFSVLHLPGHSRGQIGLWEEKTGLLFTGDAIYDGELLDNMYEGGQEEYMETMHRLKEFPANVVHGGHCPSFGQQRMTELIDDYIAGRRRSGCPQSKIRTE